VQWWDGPKPPGNVKGALKQVDCLSGTHGQARLVVESADHKTLKLLVADPGKVMISGSGDLTLGCGTQNARPVTIAYFPKNNARLGTAGEVATIEFQ
jgi:hypothetical protein